MLTDLFRSASTRKYEKADRDQLIQMLEQGEILLDERERRLLLNVMEVQGKIVREIMVPRIDMITVQEQQTAEDVIRLVRKHGHSRLPLIGEDADTVTGIIYAKDFILDDFKSIKRKSLKSLSKEPYFVPETKKVLDLLDDFRLRHIHLAIVVDEYGGVSGLVSLENILEMFVGDIQDEYDEEKEQVKKLSRRKFLLDARMGVDLVNQQCQSSFPEGQADTIGGLFLELKGTVPDQNDTVEWENYRLKAVKVKENRIETIELFIVPQSRVANNGD